MNPARSRREKLSPVVRQGLDAFGDVLAQPTRARLFGLLAAHVGPVGTKELAVELGLHPSGVRVHLERLHDAGLVSRELILQTRGGPALRLAAGVRHAPGRGCHPTCIGAWLAGAQHPDPPRTPARGGARRAGTRRELAHGRSGAVAEETMGRRLTALGFVPQRTDRKGGEVTFTLRNCPYRDVAHDEVSHRCRGVTASRSVARGMAVRVDIRNRVVVLRRW